MPILSKSRLASYCSILISTINHRKNKNTATAKLEKSNDCLGFTAQLAFKVRVKRVFVFASVAVRRPLAPDLVVAARALLRQL